MKKLILILALFGCSYCSHSQQIVRLNQSEISENKTPSAVAYNFVTSIIEEDYAKAVELMSTRYFFELMPALIMDGIPINQLFSTAYTHEIVDMRPVVELGYNVVITERHPIDSKTDKEKASEFDGLPAYSISFGCADANNKFYDGSHGKYDVETTVFLIQEEGEWKIFGFE